MPSVGNWGCCPYPKAVSCGDYTCCPEATTCVTTGSSWRAVSTCVSPDGSQKAPGVEGGGQEVCKTGGNLPFDTARKNVIILGDSVSIGYAPKVPAPAACNIC